MHKITISLTVFVFAGTLSPKCSMSVISESWNAFCALEGECASAIPQTQRPFMEEHVVGMASWKRGSNVTVGM